MFRLAGSGICLAPFRAIAGAASLRENESARRWATRRNRMQSVGVIHQLTRYPVKSMQGEALPSVALTLQGFAEDRRYAFVQATSRSSFPWLTARELPELLYYRTSVEKAGTPEVAVTVATAHGENWPIESEELRKALEARSGRALFTAGRTMSRRSRSSPGKPLRVSRKKAE